MASASLFAHAQIVNIPDANFKAYLVSSSINTNSDTEIQVSEAQAYSFDMVLTNKNISDLTGIEAFINVPVINCSGNNITSLDLSSSMPNLGKLTIGTEPLSNIDISGCTALTELYINGTNLTGIDLSNNTSLTYVTIYNSELVALDISSISSISELACAGNNLVELNLANGNNSNFTFFVATQNPNLTCVTVDDVAYSNANWSSNIDASASFSTNCPPCIVNIPDANFKANLVGNTAINTNGDTEIQCGEAAAFSGTIICSSSNISDLTGIEAFTNLDLLSCWGNSLTTLDLSNNLSLTGLYCSDNNLVNLDLSLHSMLTELDCSSNNLSTLNVANGNNVNMSNINFNARYNSNLTCIEVDDVVHSSSWALIDAQTSFSEDCQSLGVNSKEQNTIEVYPNPTSNILNFSEEMQEVQVYDLSGKLVLSNPRTDSQIDISVLEKGAYLIHLHNENGASIKKIIKE